MNTQKRCTRCGAAKDLEDFSYDARRLDGRMSRCLACCAEVAAAKRQADPEAERAKDRAPSRKKRRNKRLAERRQTEPAWRASADAKRERYRQLQRSGITTDDLYERDGAVCHICTRHVERDDAEPDHVLAFANGGTNDPANVRLAHRSCNRRKADLLDWSHLRAA